MPIQIEDLIEELKSNDFKQSDDHSFFQEIIKVISEIIKTGTIYCRGVKYFGTYECEINDHKLTLHFQYGKFKFLTSQADNFTQTFNKTTFEI